MIASGALDESSQHLVQFYDDDELLLASVVRFARTSLAAGGCFVAIATKRQLTKLEERLGAWGWDVPTARLNGRYVPMDAVRTLSETLRDGRPDPKRFAEVVGVPIRAAAASSELPVHIFGETAGQLWAEAKPDAAIQLEELWNDFAREIPFSLLCAYPINVLRPEARSDAFLRICQEHSDVIPAKSYSALDSPEKRRPVIASLPQQAGVMEGALEKNENTAESLSRLAAIVESSDDAIIGKTLEGIITSWNASAERIFGFTAQEMIGQSISRLIPADRPDDFPKILQTIRRGERVDHYDTERLHKDGHRIQVALTVSPIKNSTGQIIGASKIARDVTVRRRLEAQREHLLGVAQRARAEAEAASRSKDKFLAMLSHELRNPLSALRNAIYSARLDSTRSERALEIAYQQTDLLGHLIDDLLDLSRIAKGRVLLNQQSVSLGEIVQRGVETAQPLTEERGHVVSVSLPPEPVRLEGDPARLEQVVVNLVTNAARYTNPGGRIDVILERHENEAMLRVRDNGTGIAPNALTQIFGLFVQAGRDQEGAVGGLGIGLAVVRELVALHGGRVEARSAGLGQGAEFVVYLPCIKEASEAEPRRLFVPEKVRNGGGLRVLVVEDNVDAAESLMMLLEVFGNQARVARDGPTALEMACADVPDLMLVDIGLPGMDGYEVARRVQKTPDLREVPLVALTGFGQEEDRRRALEAGFDHHLTKPVDPQRLRRLVAGYAPTPRSAGDATA